MIHFNLACDMRAPGFGAAPAECMAIARREGTLSFKPLLSGLDPAFAWRGLRLFARAVLPHLRAAAAPEA